MHCFQGNFTQLEIFLHDRRSWRSRQISSLRLTITNPDDRCSQVIQRNWPLLEGIWGRKCGPRWIWQEQLICLDNTVFLSTISSWQDRTELFFKNVKSMRGNRPWPCPCPGNRHDRRWWAPHGGHHQSHLPAQGVQEGHRPGVFLY